MATDAPARHRRAGQTVGKHRRGRDRALEQRQPVAPVRSRFRPHRDEVRAAAEARGERAGPVRGVEPVAVLAEQEQPRRSGPAKGEHRVCAAGDVEAVQVDDVDARARDRPAARLEVAEREPGSHVVATGEGRLQVVALPAWPLVGRRHEQRVAAGAAEAGRVGEVAAAREEMQRRRARERARARSEKGERDAAPTGRREVDAVLDAGLHLERPRVVVVGDRLDPRADALARECAAGRLGRGLLAEHRQPEAAVV